MYCSRVAEETDTASPPLRAVPRAVGDSTWKSYSAAGSFPLLLSCQTTQYGRSARNVADMPNWDPSFLYSLQYSNRTDDDYVDLASRLLSFTVSSHHGTTTHTQLYLSSRYVCVSMLSLKI